MKKVFSKRIKITKSGKIIRRHMGLGHCKAKRSNRQKTRKKQTHAVKSVNIKFFKRYA